MAVTQKFAKNGMGYHAEQSQKLGYPWTDNEGE